MTGKGLRAYNNAPTKEILRKGRKVKWREITSNLFMLDRFMRKHGKAICSIVEKLE